jgi:hypothetical protein
MSSTAATEVAEREYVALMRPQRARAVILIGSRTDDTAAREALRAEIAAFTGSGGRAVAVGQDLLGVDTCCRRTRPAPRRWPAPWSRSATAASPCWPGRAAC